MRGGERGFTLIELMVGLVVSSIAVGFIFRIYATSSVAYRTQSQLAETMQSARTAKQLLTYEGRTAGYYARFINSLVNTGVTGHIETGGTVPTGVYMVNPIQVVDSSSSADELRVLYADPASPQTIVTSPATFGSTTSQTVSTVASTAGFAVGDLVLAVRAAASSNNVVGAGCLLKLTGVSSTQLTYASGGSPYNSATNPHCNQIASSWGDGHTVFVKAKFRAFRIKPSDARGVLQLSESQGQSNDWQDLAFGFVDLQVAEQIYTPGDAVDEDGDGSGPYDWYSGSNMTSLSLAGTTTLSQLHVSLLARTIAEVDGPGTTVTPSMLGSTARASNNDIGNHDSVTISSISSTSSPYYGNYLYRIMSTMIDLRNLGSGAVQ